MLFRSLCDSQYSNAHMEQFGLIEIPAAEYLARLEDAVEANASWEPSGHG